MPKTTQLALSLVSRPGTLAALARTLAEAGVNITALSAAETSGRGKIRLLVNDPVRAKRALRRAKYRASEEGPHRLNTDLVDPLPRRERERVGQHKLAERRGLDALDGPP